MKKIKKEAISLLIEADDKATTITTGIAEAATYIIHLFSHGADKLEITRLPETDELEQVKNGKTISFGKQCNLNEFDEFIRKAAEDKCNERPENTMLGKIDEAVTYLCNGISTYSSSGYLEKAQAVEALANAREKYLLKREGD